MIFWIFSFSSSYVYIRDNEDNDLKICGKNIPEPIISASTNPSHQSYLNYRFTVLNNDDQQNGFSANYECLPPQCLNTTIIAAAEFSSGSFVSHYDYPG